MPNNPYSAEMGSAIFLGDYLLLSTREKLHRLKVNTKCKLCGMLLLSQEDYDKMENFITTTPHVLLNDAKTIKCAYHNNFCSDICKEEYEELYE